MELYEINVMVAVCIAVAIFLIWLSFYPENLNFLMNRIEGDGGYKAKTFEKTKEAAIFAAFLPYAQKISAKNHKKVKKEVLDKLDILLESAGRPLHMEPIDFYNIKFVAAPIFAVVGIVLCVALDFPAAFGLVGAVVGYILPEQILKSMVKKRTIQADIELPNILDLISVCMASGMTLMKAISVICQRNTGLLVDELRKVQSDIDRGASMISAFESLTRRVKSKKLREVYQNVKLSETFGTPIATQLKTLGDSVRQSTFELAKQKAAKAAVMVLFPVLFFILPAVIIIVLGPLSVRMMNG